MFVIIQDESVIYGPAEYNLINFKAILKRDLKIIDSKISLTEEVPSSVIKIGDAFIMPAEVLKENITNQMFQQYAGPFWVIDELKAVGTLKVVDKSVDEVKALLKEQVKEIRFNKETADINMIVNGVDVLVSGSRENKMNLTQLIMTMGTEIIDFKFSKSDNFVKCVSEDISNILKAIMTQVQGAFSWEANKYSEIDACLTLDSLKVVTIN